MKRRLPIKRRLLLAGLVLLLAVVLSNYLLHKDKSGNQVKEGAAKPVVDVVTLVRSDMIRQISLTGQTAAEAQIDIAAKYAGRVARVDVSLGQQVAAGDVLVIQDTGDVDLSIDQTEALRRQAAADATETQATFDANYHRVQADYQRSSINYTRYQSLHRMGAVSKEALDSIEQQMVNAKAALEILDNQSVNGVTPAMVESKRAAVVKTERNIAALQKQRDDLILRAPRSGTIGYRQVEAGALVQAGQKLLTLVDNSMMYVDCEMSEQEIAHIGVGMPVVVEIESLGNIYAGSVIYVSPSSDAATKKYMVRIALAAASDRLVRSGMFARAKVSVLQREQTLVVPREAVIERNGKQYVMVVGAGNITQERLVTVGLRNDGSSELISGVAEGEQIAISNLARLRTGLQVAVRSVGAPAAMQGGGQ